MRKMTLSIALPLLLIGPLSGCHSPILKIDGTDTLEAKNAKVVMTSPWSTASVEFEGLRTTRYGAVEERREAIQNSVSTAPVSPSDTVAPVAPQTRPSDDSAPPTPTPEQPERPPVALTSF